ncbi:MAG: hypothetical protein L0Y66_22740 [Myxococcaceae bacterium]|nr:hypothetical protein [Myxococcaceae bacterium]MCI0672472.1 hypothetical protein [Myxococcaceae bacterium]
MATGKRTAAGGRRQGRRALRKVRHPAPKLVRRTVTLGELVAAVFDTAGDTRSAAALLGSRELAHAVGRRIICV